jgi:hypothetical protein
VVLNFIFWILPLVPFFHVKAASTTSFGVPDFRSNGITSSQLKSAKQAIIVSNEYSFLMAFKI